MYLLSFIKYNDDFLRSFVLLYAYFCRTINKERPANYE